jgi:hypothetical protein
VAAVPSGPWIPPLTTKIKKKKKLDDIENCMLRRFIIHTL